MAETDTREQARAIIAAILADLDEDRIKQRIDEPVDAVVGRFSGHGGRTVTSEVFHIVVAGLLQRIYIEVLNKPMRKTDALGEALDLLDRHYQSPVYGRGYVAARLDACDPAHGGLQDVILSLAEIVKADGRQKYVQGAFCRHLAGIDWDVRCQIVRLLLEQDVPFVPERLSGHPPGLLTDEIAALICSHLEMDSILHGIASRQ